MRTVPRRGEQRQVFPYAAGIDILTPLLLVAGLALLVAGGEFLVTGAGGLARAAGLSPLVIGVTVVGFATSAPELAVTLNATLGGAPALAVGNVVGSNIANILLILGVTAVVLPVVATSRVVRLDVPVMIGLSVLALLLSLDGTVSRLDGVVLFGVLVAYLPWSVLASRRELRSATGADGGATSGAGGAGGPVGDGPIGDGPVGDGPVGDGPIGGDRRPRVALDALRVLLGVGLLVLGARWLVGSATDLATAVGVSDLVVGLTVVAVGTSLPELVTSLVAARRGEVDLAIGNVVGSNVFNLGAVLGVAAIVSSVGVPVDTVAQQRDLPLMVVVALVLLPVVVGAAIARRLGGLLVGCYLAYLGATTLTATGVVAPAPALVVTGLATVLLGGTAAVLAATARRAARGRPG